MKIIIRVMAAIVLMSVLLCSCAAAVDGDAVKLDVIAKGKGAGRPAVLQVNDRPSGTQDQGDKPELTGEVVLNTNSKTIHTDAGCSSVKTMKDANKKIIDPSEIQEYLDNGYKYCSRCSSAYIGQ